MHLLLVQPTFQHSSHSEGTHTEQLKPLRKPLPSDQVKENHQRSCRWRGRTTRPILRAESTRKPFKKPGSPRLLLINSSSLHLLTLVQPSAKRQLQARAFTIRGVCSRKQQLDQMKHVCTDEHGSRQAAPHRHGKATLLSLVWKHISCAEAELYSSIPVWASNTLARPRLKRTPRRGFHGQPASADEVGSFCKPHVSV